jgi:hypothetical protein
VIPDSVTHIGEEAFCNNQLTSVVIGNSVTSIGWDAFRNNRLTSVVIPNSLTSIDGWAFINNQLTSVVIGNSVRRIGKEAFSGNQLTSIVIGDNVDIDEGAFRDDNEKGRRRSYFEDVYNKNKKKAGTYTRTNVKSKKWKFNGHLIPQPSQRAGV